MFLASKNKFNQGTVYGCLFGTLFASLVVSNAILVTVAEILTGLLRNPVYFDAINFL